MKILVIDNYDSFVYNLVCLLYNLGVEDISVVKNDKVELPDADKYDKILLSPGPGVPENAGKMPDMIRHYAGSKSILGVCLGHQGIAQCFGATLTNLDEPLHGIASSIDVLKEHYLFNDCPATFSIGHYHSWVINEKSMGDCLDIIARDSKGHIMSVAHNKYDVVGVQFHPESVLTEYGEQMISNWVNHTS